MGYQLAAFFFQKLWSIEGDASDADVWGVMHLTIRRMAELKKAISWRLRRFEGFMRTNGRRSLDDYQEQYKKDGLEQLRVFMPGWRVELEILSRKKLNWTWKTT
jgi:hypothetical protein